MTNYNLANMPESERQAMEAHKIALFWTNQIRAGKITREKVAAKLRGTPEPMRGLIRAELRKLR